MNKIALFTLLLLVLNISNAQDLNESNNGFFKVVQTEKSNDEVYQRAKEWIAINFKSSNDVLQLDTNEKLIVKGSDKFTFVNYRSAPFGYIGQIMLTVSIRDNRFKVEYEILDLTSIEFPQMGSTHIEDFIWWKQRKMSEEELLDFRLKVFQEAPANKKRKEKWMNKVKKAIYENNPQKYRDQQYNYNQLFLKVSLTINSLSDYINSSITNDDW